MLHALKAIVAAAALVAATCASALEIKPYSAEALAAAQAAGQPVAVQFHADWCPTCRKQEKAMSGLKADPELAGVTVLVADFDEEKDLKKQMNVRMQSTIVVFKGRQEVTRSAGVTDASALRAVLAQAR